MSSSDILTFVIDEQEIIVNPDGSIVVTLLLSDEMAESLQCGSQIIDEGEEV